MKIFRDKEQSTEVSMLELGIVEAGEFEEYTFWIYNDSNAFLKNLKCVVEHEEVKMLECPRELPAFGVGEVRIRWSPLVTLKEGLKTKLKIRAKELWG